MRGADVARPDAAAQPVGAVVGTPDRVVDVVERQCRQDRAEDLLAGDAHVEIDGRPPLAVYHVDGEFFVSDDTCTHGEASLAEGTVDGGRIECPWHNGSSCLRTARP